MATKDEIIADIQRVAARLEKRSVTTKEFSQYGNFSSNTVRYVFGSWNEAIVEAGLDPIAPRTVPVAEKIPEDDLLREIIHLAELLGKAPTEADMNSKGKFSTTPYKVRWGSLKKARQLAYARYGFPNVHPDVAEQNVQSQDKENRSNASRIVIPETHKPPKAIQRKKIQFGEPIDFRGLRFAPINEQGVVYVFGMISRELNFLIESIRTEYPDCEGKRCVDKEGKRWEHVAIEFEYKSSNFRAHGHSPENCDLIVCWIHDWDQCPIEVLELRSQIQFLPKG